MENTFILVNQIKKWICKFQICKNKLFSVRCFETICDQSDSSTVMNFIVFLT